jgi:N-6 DNA Methylase
LKGPKTHDLYAIMPGRNKSPVQQAWEYAIDAPGAKWVLVSNCAEIRLYAFGHGRELYETWDLGRLDNPQEHERLWLLIGAHNLLSGRTAALLDESANEQKDITDKLYVDYKKTRDTLIQTLQDQPPRLTALAAIEHAQTILDRVLFIAFAQSTSLLPERLLQKAWDQKSPFRPNAAWENFVGLFDAVDKGNPALDIPAYNGGLFARNAIIDALGLSNYVCENFAKIADYDFSSDVPVSVLGHIFEQSVSDIEKMRAEAQGQPPPKTSKRKREGVIYTPDFVTRFIVEETISKTLSERFAALLKAHGVAETRTEDGVSYSWPKKTELEVWRAYSQELRGLAVVDPACGSGAFLIAAFDYLAAEYRRVTERLAALGDSVDASEVDSEILARNLHGVDLNPEPVEITKLSLWLKTAKRGKLLQDLDASIKCGNSLIANKTAAPSIGRRSFRIFSPAAVLISCLAIRPMCAKKPSSHSSLIWRRTLRSIRQRRTFMPIFTRKALSFCGRADGLVTFPRQPFFAPARVNHCGTICARARKSRMLWISAICKSLKASRLIQRS